MKRLIFLCLAGIAVSCSQTPPPPRATAVAEAEQEFEQETDTLEMRAEVRRAATALIQERTPEWAVKGTHLTVYSNNEFWAVVDIQRGQERRTVELEVLRLFPEEGEPYWKARLLTLKRRQMRHDAADAETLRRLNDSLDEDQAAEDDQP